MKVKIDKIALATNNNRVTITEIRVASLAIAIMAILLCFDMLAGPLRYYLSKVGLDAVVYIPKAACLIFVLHELIRNHIDRSLFYITLFLIFYTCTGNINQIAFKSQIFMMIAITPFVFGVAASRYLYEMEDIFVKLMGVVLVITSLGVLIDVFIDFPWKGFLYNFGGAQIEGNTEWSYFGIDRIAGFARMSVAAAFYILCSSLFLYSYCRSRLLKSFLLIIALPAIVVTTTKASILGLILGIISIMLASYPRVIKLFVFGLATTVMLLPISTALLNYELDLANPSSVLMFASFEARLIRTWPNFISAVDKFGNPFLGVGFGGIGSSIRFFGHGGQDSLIFADNFALYLYGCFGLAAIAIVFYFAQNTLKLFTSQERLARSLAPVMVALLAVSLTIDIIDESQIFALMLGLAITITRVRRSSASVYGTIVTTKLNA